MPYTSAIIDNIYRVVFLNTAPSPAFPTQIFVGLYKTVPTSLDGSGGVECTTGDFTQYARQGAIAFTTPALTRQIANTGIITFAPSATLGGAGFQVNGGGLFSALTGGFLVAYGALATPLTIGNGSLVQIPVGQLTVFDPGFGVL